LREKPVRSPCRRKKAQGRVSGVKRNNAEQRETERVAPSARGGGLGRDLALRRGSAVHRLLETLPERDQIERADLAKLLLMNEFPDLPSGEVSGIIAEALAVLVAPLGDEVFGSGSLAEVPLALDLPEVSPRLMLGRIDRVVLTPGAVLVVDFKTDSRPPEAPENVPGSYLAQLGAYRAAASAIWPDRRAEAAILWTALPALMRISAKLLDRALAVEAARINQAVLEFKNGEP